MVISLKLTTNPNERRHTISFDFYLKVSFYASRSVIKCECFLSIIGIINTKGSYPPAKDQLITPPGGRNQTNFWEEKKIKVDSIFTKENES